MVSSILVVETFIKEILSKIDARATDKCFGQMEVFTKASGKMVFKTEKAKFI
jgi:hypothetical protein